MIGNSMLNCSTTYPYARKLLNRFGLIMVAILITPAAGISQDKVDPDWPCIQAYVPEVAAAVVWPEPIDENIAGSWRKDDKLKPVVRDFGSLEIFTDADRERLVAFAESIPEEQRIDTYNRVADGIVIRFNQRRREYFKGIRKFTRQQIAVASTIESHLNELADLEGKTDAASMQRKQDLEETTAWQQRIFDRREGAITLLCETPVELETVMGDILRELAQFLP